MGNEAPALRVGAYVRFLPGSPHHGLGLRRGTVVALDVRLADHVRRHREHMAAVGETSPLAPELAEALEGGRGEQRVLVVRADPSDLAPFLYEFPCAPEWLEVVEGQGAALVN